MTDSIPTILVVDDQLLNIRLLERKLERSEMQVISATNGDEALRLAHERRPDVILLDIIMPGMDGIEVCRQLKQDEATKDIPVIFITANTSKEEKIEGLDVGAADYLIKPLELDETLARVRTQLRIVHEHQDNLRLTRQLEESRRQTSIMHLTEGIAHNLNNLLGVMIGYISLMQRNAKNPEKILGNCERLEAAIKRMTRIVHQLTVIGHFKSLQQDEIALGKILEGAIGRFQRTAGNEHPVQVSTDLSGDWKFKTNRELLEASLERLLQNSYESYFRSENDPAPEIGEVLLRVHKETTASGENLEFQVLDRGKGIDKAIENDIFEPFVSSSSVVGRGMGLTIARHGIHCLGGTISVGARQGGGSQAIIRIPLSGLGERYG